MRSADFRICPSCDSRNKLKWEYCVRCGESLQEVPAGGEAPEPAAETGAAEAANEEFRPGVPWLSLTGIGALVVFGVIALRPRPTAEAARPDPSAFHIPTLPPELPSAAPVEKGPGSEEFERGRALLRRGQAAEAVDLLAQATALDGGNALFRQVYGQALWQAGAKDQAIDQFRVAVRLDADTYRMDLARALAGTGRPADAVLEYEQVLAGSPNNVPAMEDLARLYDGQGETQRALSLWRQVAASNPNDVVKQQSMARVLEKAGDLGGAADVYRDIMSQFRDAHVPRTHLAEILFQQGQGAEAIATVREGLQGYPNSPVLQRGLATLLERAGQTAEAVAAYREYARLAPGAPDARELADRADQLEKRASSS
jgi:predicted Zn-dependent protease